jgi:hypothetical protein
MAVKESASERHAPTTDVLELLVKIAALVVVVLPAVGGGVRATAFALAGVPSPLEMAVAEPVSDLVTTALKAVVPITAGLVVLAPSIYRDWPRPNVAPHYYHRMPTPFALVIGGCSSASPPFSFRGPAEASTCWGSGLWDGYWDIGQHVEN